MEEADFYLQQTVDRVSQVLSGLDILSGEAVVPLDVFQEFVEGLEVMSGGSGQVGQGGVQLPQSGESLVAGLGDVVQALAQVVAVVLAQATEPTSPGELGTLLLQGENIFSCQELSGILGHFEIPGSLLTLKLQLSLFFDPVQSLPLPRSDHLTAGGLHPDGGVFGLAVFLLSTNIAPFEFLFLWRLRNVQGSSSCGQR